MSRFYLIGYMASGKSRLGKELSQRTGIPFVDLDVVFEERYRIGILDFFGKYGEEVFRKLERGLLLETGKLERTIIATGGGTPCSADNMDFIKRNGISIYLRMSTGDLAERLRSIRRQRPVLTNVPPEELESFIRRQIEEREGYYLRADHVVDVPLADLDPLVELILKLADQTIPS